MNWLKPFLVADMFAIVVFFVSVAAAVVIIAMYWGEELSLGNFFKWKCKQRPKSAKP